MSQIHKKYPHVIAISPSSRGFGFAVLEGREMLVNWGLKTVVKGDKNAQCISKVKKLITHYKPEVMVLENCSTKHCRRSVRIRKLIQAITNLASAHEVNVSLFSKGQVRQVLIPNSKGTKHELAENLARRFPDDLSIRLPKKRKLWENENRWMDMFEAVALALMFRITSIRKQASTCAFDVE